jgi:hypothetical protein
MPGTATKPNHSVSLSIPPVNLAGATLQDEHAKLVCGQSLRVANDRPVVKLHCSTTGGQSVLSLTSPSGSEYLTTPIGGAIRRLPVDPVRGLLGSLALALALAGMNALTRAGARTLLRAGFLASAVAGAIVGCGGRGNSGEHRGCGGQGGCDSD